jgi:hypothetical protein
MVVRVDGKRFGPAASQSGQDAGAFLEKPPISAVLRRALLVFAYGTLIAALAMSLSTGELLYGKGGPHLQACRSGYRHIGSECVPNEGIPQGTVVSMQHDQVCLKVFISPHVLCYETAALWRVSRWIDVGSYARIYYDADGRITGLSTYHGQRPM